MEQLTYCSQYETCISSHGAQLINALSVKSNIVEFMPYPYSLSEWSLTMLKMCNSLFIRRFEILGFQLDSPILSRQALFHSYHPSPLDSSFSSFWQSSPVYINIDRVRSILESSLLINEQNTSLLVLMVSLALIWLSIFFHVTRLEPFAFITLFLLVAGSIHFINLS